MKKLLFLSLLIGNSLLSQNGLTAYPMPVGYTQTNVKTAITVDNSGNSWVGFRFGIGKFDGANWTVFDTTNTPQNSEYITALSTQNGSVIWAATKISQTSGELFSYNGSVWTNYTTNINSNYTNAIAADNSTGTVWIGTKAGLYKYDGTTWTNYTVANSGLASDTVLSLAIDPSGNVLAGTQQGLSIRNGNSWTNYTSANVNFPSNVIKAVYSDATNGIWLSVDGMPGRFALSYFAPIDSILLIATPNYSHLVNSISRGPHGGVIFSGNYGCLIEVISNQPAFYYYNNITWNTILAFNPANGKTYIVNGVAGGYLASLFAFDGNYTHELGEGYNGLTVNNCRFLDVNNVRTAILDRGDKNWNSSSASYEVPKGGGTHSVFASSLWIGGLDNGGGLHQAAMTYRQTGIDYFPGPLDTTNGTTDSITSLQYDYIWRIQKLKIQEFQYYWSTGAVQNGSYTPDPDILSWPAQGTGNFTRNMAPFIDVDGNGIYNPLTGGDYPDIKGDEMLYCIYNDNLSAHTETGGVPLKVEIHASAYAYFCPTVADSMKVINYTTYYNYEIFNRSGNTYNNTYLGMFHDVDLGYYKDDYVGCVSTENFSYTCNGDVNDGSSASPALGTYGAHPPIISFPILNGPVADPGDGIDNDNDGTIDEIGEVNLMTGHLYYNNDFTVTGNPEHADDYYLYLSGKWKDSTNLTYGGNGYGGIIPTHFAYDGMMYDTAAWTELSAGNPPDDRRNLTSCGPFTLTAGQHVNFNYAIVYSRDTTVGPPDSLYYDQAVYDVRRVRNWYTTQSEPSCIQWGVGIHEPAAPPIDISLYPNPASAQITIAYDPQSVNASYEIVDMTGRVIQQGKMERNGQTVISVAAYSSGIYLVRVVDGDQLSYQKFIRQ